MLSLEINGQSVDLPEDFSMTLNLKSPVFNDLGSFSYPFKLPRTLRNITILKFKDRIENTGDPWEEFPAVFKWNGIHGPTGTLRCKTFGDKYFEGNIFEREGDFYGLIASKKIQQFDYDLPAFLTEQTALDYFNNCAHLYYPDVPIAFPEIDNGFYFDPVATDPELLKHNPYNDDGELYLLTAENNRTLLIPHLYLKHVCDIIFKNLEYTLDDQLMTHADFNRLVIYNSLSCNSFLASMDYSVKKIYGNLHLPVMAVKDFLKAIEQNFGARYFVDTKKKHARLITLRSIVENSIAQPFNDNVLGISSEIDDKIDGYIMKMNLDSDDAELDALTTLEDQLMDFYKGSVQSVLDLPVFPFAEVGEIRFVVDANDYYQYTPALAWVANPIIGWNLRSQFIYQGGKEAITLPFGSLASAYFVKSGNKGDNWKKITPRLFFVEEYQPPGDPYKVKGYDHTDNQYLFFDWDNKDPFSLYWKQFLDWRMGARGVKIVKQMNWVEIMDLDFSCKYMINGMKYLIADCQVPIKKGKIMPATLKMYPCL